MDNFNTKTALRRGFCVFLQKTASKIRIIQTLMQESEERDPNSLSQCLI